MKLHLFQELLALNQQFDCVIRGLERMEMELSRSLTPSLSPLLAIASPNALDVAVWDVRRFDDI
jgi:hypothetical protein